METPITFLSGQHILEGLLYRVPGDNGVIITHPHSLYGGNMHNPVVESLQRVYAKNGFSTLRFNFRGVGRSSGEFDNGCGEQHDVLAALDYLTASYLSSFHLVGYSFGARVLAGIESLPESVISQVFVAPPVAFMDFSDITDIRCLKLIVAGENDDIAPPAIIEQQVKKWSQECELKVIGGADHFFGSSLAELEQSVNDLLNLDSS